MTLNQQMFIYAAEELNFTKAAKRAYVSQQCLSSHIARLEKEYNVTLFERKPRSIKLTWAGRRLYRALMQIKRIEESTAEEIVSEGENSSGTVIVGMPSSRASLLVAPMVSAFNRKYPNVRVQIILRKTADLLEMLETGVIDFLVGIDVNADENNVEIVLTHERCLLYLSDNLVRRFLPGLDPSPETKLSASTLAKLPLSGMPDDAKIKLKLTNFMSQKSIQLRDFCTVDNYTTLMMLAKKHVSAFVGSECVLWSDLFKMLRRNNSHDKIYAFPIEGFDTKMKISLVYNKWSILPVYTKDLIKIIRDIYQQDAYINYLKKA